MAISALKAAQLSAALAAATQNFSPGETPQTRFAKDLLGSAQETIKAENIKKAAKKAKKGNGIFDTVRRAAGMIPGPQQPFIMAGNAVYDATQGNAGAAIQQGASAGMGFSQQYGGGTANWSNANMDPAYNSRRVASGVPVGEDPALKFAGSGAVPGAPAMAPAAAVVAQPTVNGPTATTSAPPVGTGTVLAPAAGGTAVPSAAPSLALPIAAGVGVAAATRQVFNQQQPAPVAPQPTALTPGTSAQVNPANRSEAMLLQSVNENPGQLRKNGALLLPSYLAQARATGQPMPTSVWQHVPHNLKKQYRKDPQYAGLIPTRSQMVQAAFAPLVAGAAVGYGASRLVPAGDGVYDYVPGG